MSTKEHRYTTTIAWTGNTGTGTSDPKNYSRNLDMKFEGKPPLPGSSDPAFRGDPSRYNPEELLVASLSACHMLWYLHLCAVSGVVVTAYADTAEGTLAESAGGGGQFTQVMLRPHVTVARGDVDKAKTLHAKAASLCFIARSVNFPVHHEPTVVMG